MYNIFLYVDKDGKESAKEYINELASKNDKNSRIKFNKLVYHIDRLGRFGLPVNDPHIKHLEGDIWELRLSNGIVFFVTWFNGSFVLLHYFVKKSQKNTKKRNREGKKRNRRHKRKGLFID